MNVAQAMEILKPEGDSLEHLKSAYRKAAKKYHPDINPKGQEMMKLVNLAFEILTNHLNKWSFSERTNGESRPSIDEAIQEIFDKIKTFAGIKAEVCGTWLWLTGKTWLYKKQLKEFGLRFAPKKQAWYWHPQDYKKWHKRSFSLDDIRHMHGSVDLETENLQAIA